MSTIRTTCTSTPDGTLRDRRRGTAKATRFSRRARHETRPFASGGLQGSRPHGFHGHNRFAIATCEFSAQVVKVQLDSEKVVGYLKLDRGWFRHSGMPQDIRSSPDGRVFYVADMKADGVFLVDPAALKQIGFLATGKGTHGLIPSRDGHLLYATNRAGIPLLEVAMVPEASASLIRSQEKSWGTGRSLTAAARTWATSRPTERNFGFRAATTTRCTSSTPAVEH